MPKLDLTVVIPVYNEQESLPKLEERLFPALDALGKSYETIFVNDGSDDGSDKALDAIHAKHPTLVRTIHFRKNLGKSAALQAAFNKAQGDVVVMMDADLQDQPEEIAKLLAPIDAGERDAITGWKYRRQDPFSKTFPSKFFNGMANRLSGLDIHDNNCGLKAFRRECLDSFVLYGQMHRFIMIFVAHQGYRVGEVKIEHAPRLYGYSKFGAKRFYHGFMDLLTVFFITRYLESPLYFFGIYGTTCLSLSVIIGGFYLSMHVLNFFIDNPSLNLMEHPLWIVSPILMLLGFIMIFFGLLGEMITYNRMSAGREYSGSIARTSGFDDA